MKLVTVAEAFKPSVNGIITSVSGNINDADAVRLDPEVKVYRNADELLADPRAQFMDLCVPTPEHLRLSVAGLKASKQVVCEKPLARTSALCRQIVKVAATAKTFFRPATCMRFWPDWDWLKRTVDRKIYGSTKMASPCRS